MGAASCAVCHGGPAEQLPSLHAQLQEGLTSVVHAGLEARFRSIGTSEDWFTKLVKSKLQEGVRASFTYAGARIDVLIFRDSSADSYGFSAYVNFDELTELMPPSLLDGMGPANFDDRSAGANDQLLNGFQIGRGLLAYLRQSARLKTVCLTAVSNPPKLQVTGTAEIATLPLGFSFKAERSSNASAWDFDLAVQTDVFLTMWNSIPYTKLAELGLQDLSPFDMPGLANVALRAHYNTGTGDGLDLEVGVLAPLQCDSAPTFQRAMDYIRGTVLPRYEAGVTIPNIEIAGRNHSVYIASDGTLVYLALFQDGAGKSISHVLQSEAGTEFSSVVAESPLQMKNYLTSVEGSTSLDSLYGHLWTDLGPELAATLRMGGVATVSTQPVGFALIVSGGTGRSADFSLTVGFDIMGFLEDHLQKLQQDFLMIVPRDHELSGQYVGCVRVTTLGQGITFEIGEVQLSGISGPVPKSMWPTALERGLDAAETIRPLSASFSLGGKELLVTIYATGGELAVGMTSNNEFSLAEVVDGVSGASLGDYLSSCETGGSVFCSLAGFLDISIGTIAMEARINSTGYAASLEVGDLVWGVLPPAHINLRVHSYDSGLQHGAGLQFANLNFGTILRRIDALSIGGQHVCDRPIASRFCDLNMSNLNVIYASHASMCEELIDTTQVYSAWSCSDGLFLVVDVEFPPSFDIEIPGLGVRFTTEHFVTLIELLVGRQIPNSTVSMMLPANPSMRNLQLRAPIASLLQTALDAGWLPPDITLGTNPEGGDLLTLHIDESEFVLDGRSGKVAPGLAAYATLNMSGYAQRRRRLQSAESSTWSQDETDHHGPDKFPFWPQRRHLQELSGPVPEVVDIHVSILSSLKGPPCGPYGDFEIKIDPPLTWVEPFGISDLDLTLGSLQGGICSTMTPHTIGFVGAFTWSTILSGMVWIELQMNPTEDATHFLYCELRCGLDPCNAYNLLSNVGVSIQSSPLVAVLSSMGVNCADPSCQLWLNMKAFSPGFGVTWFIPNDARTIQNFTSPDREDLHVPGGFGVNIGKGVGYGEWPGQPGFYFLGLSGFAFGTMGATAGNLTGVFGGQLDLPWPLQWLKIGGGVHLHLDYSTAGFGLELSGWISWLDFELAANLETSLDIDSGVAAQWSLGIAVHLPVWNTPCVIDLAIVANAAVSYTTGDDNITQAGFDGDFNFDGTRFNNELGPCLWDQVSPAIELFWDSQVGQWIRDAGDFLLGIAREAIAWASGSVNGDCTKIDGQGECHSCWWGNCIARTCEVRSHCEPNPHDICIGECVCGEDAIFGAVRTCACRPNFDCGPGTVNAGYEFDGCGRPADYTCDPDDDCCTHDSGRRRQLHSTEDKERHLNASKRLPHTADADALMKDFRRRQQEMEDQNLTQTPLGRKLKQNALRLGRNGTLLQPLNVSLVTLQELMDAECLRWDAPASMGERRCLERTSRFWQTKAATKWFKMVREQPAVKLAMEMNKDRDVPTHYDYSTKNYGKHMAQRRGARAFNRTTSLRNNRTRAFDKNTKEFEMSLYHRHTKLWGLDTISEMTDALADGIVSTGNFFTGCDPPECDPPTVPFRGDVLDVHFFELDTNTGSLGDLFSAESLREARAVISCKSFSTVFVDRSAEVFLRSYSILYCKSATIAACNIVHNKRHCV